MSAPALLLPTMITSTGRRANSASASATRGETGTLGPPSRAHTPTMSSRAGARTATAEARGGERKTRANPAPRRYVRIMLLLPLLLACADDTSHDSAAASRTPTITFVSPTEGESIPEGSVGVSIAVNQFVLVDVSKHSENGAEGVIRFTSAQGRIWDTFDTGATTFTIPLTLGDAQLTAELRYEDGDEITEDFPDYTPATIGVIVE